MSTCAVLTVTNICEVNFNHEIQEHIKVERSEKCKILELTETLNQCSVYFLHNEETIICAFVIPRNTDKERIKQMLPPYRERICEAAESV